MDSLKLLQEINKQGIRCKSVIDCLLQDFIAQEETKFGLDEALKEYFNSLNTANLLAVNYQSVGMSNRLDSNTEIIIYRIIQELMNNILKHAAASQVFVQLIKDNNRLNIVVEDNGKGFDTAILENNKGAGWANIRSRVEYLKGQLDIHSEAGKGTLVNIEFNV